MAWMMFIRWSILRPRGNAGDRGQLFQTRRSAGTGVYSSCRTRIRSNSLRRCFRASTIACASRLTWRIRTRWRAVGAMQTVTAIPPVTDGRHPNRARLSPNSFISASGTYILTGFDHLLFLCALLICVRRVGPMLGSSPVYTGAFGDAGTGGDGTGKHFVARHRTADCGVHHCRRHRESGAARSPGDRY